MIIGIDIRGLGHPYRSGVVTYTENILEHLLPLDPHVNYKLFYTSRHHELPRYPWLDLPNVQLKNFHLSNRFLSVTSRLLYTPKIDKILGGVDVFFSPHFFFAPLSPKTKRVTTFHDLSFERFPEFFTLRQKLWHTAQMQPAWQARFSDAIIAVSESTKQDITTLYEIDAAKIHSVYSGVSEKFKPISESELDRFKQERHLPEKFVLFVGTIEPRKNISGLLKAFETLRQKEEFADLELVVAGPSGWHQEAIFETAERSTSQNHITFIGGVWDWELPFYYSAASVLVYPSFFEGFGFPPLEAMACGTPVISSHNSSMPEVIGDAGLLIDPRSTQDLVRALESILTDPRLASTLKSRGLARVKEFTWQKTALETLEILRRV
ncbi:MAG: glycosyltransferase family 4 protein [Candidatus Yanofskybacteria bacterium]|nr:glycosyltransferase family 4 protein [Candidatus Yanofskybacteria bacterium]